MIVTFCHSPVTYFKLIIVHKLLCNIIIYYYLSLAVYVHVMSQLSCIEFIDYHQP